MKNLTKQPKFTALFGFIAIIAIITIGFGALTGCHNSYSYGKKVTSSGGGGTGHTHTLGAAATCTSPQVCTDCGGVIVAALGHNFVWTVTTPPSPYANGVETGLPP